MRKTIKPAKPGDYIITKENELYRITDIEVDEDNISYTIKSLNSSVEFIETYSNKYYREIKGLSQHTLNHLGTVIPEEEASNTLNLLYKS